MADDKKDDGEPTFSVEVRVTARAAGGGRVPMIRELTVKFGEPCDDLNVLKSQMASIDLKEVFRRDPSAEKTLEVPHRNPAPGD